ncbi:LysM peptidoglycan-binding domain-containing protein [Candidatus Leptofilum sp.]|uniref:LysM peptidoglycan-binding domain-containing protein n=1 Tax=Candidatus Leptofilum sp. TaxID=3241576 RepID=UPI003B59016F
MDFKIESEEILDYLSDNWLTVTPIFITGLLLIGYLFFTLGTLLPRWQQRTELIATSATAEAAATERAAQQQAATGQRAAAQAEFDASANRFLTEAQAALFLDGLYDSAVQTAVTIVDLQVQPMPQGASPGRQKPVYDTRQFRLEAIGALPQLNQFVGHIEQTAVPSVTLQNLLITSGEDENSAILTLELLLYTSPFSTGESVADLPDSLPTAEATAVPQPTVTPAPTAMPDVSNLVSQLDAPWAAENWPEVIRIIQEIRQQAPSEPGMAEKLYAARVNYGYQLAGLGDTNGAAEQFEQALAIFPQGTEAEVGLQSLFAPAPTATPETTIYVVKRGDTLYSIARRFGSTVDAVKVANGLISNNITPGQQLIIP